MTATIEPLRELHDEARHDLGRLTRVCFESGEYVYADAAKELLGIALGLLHALNTALIVAESFERRTT